MNATSRPWKRKGERADGFADIVSNNGRIVIASFWGSDPIAYANCTTTLKAVNTFAQAREALRDLIGLAHCFEEDEPYYFNKRQGDETVAKAQAVLAQMEAEP